MFLVLDAHPPRVDQDAAFDLVVDVADGTLRELDGIAERLAGLLSGEEGPVRGATTVRRYAAPRD